jgi:hypothetical protein
MYNLLVDKKFTGPLGKFSPDPRTALQFPNIRTIILLFIIFIYKKKCITFYGDKSKRILS